jgi:hypothetical protein
MYIQRALDMRRAIQDRSHLIDASRSDVTQIESHGLSLSMLCSGSKTWLAFLSSSWTIATLNMDDT